MWHDDGIPSGATFMKHVGNKIKNCKVVMCFLSRNYVASDYCMKELHFAMQNNRTVIPIFLNKFELPDNIEFEFELLGTKPAYLYRFDYVSQGLEKMIEDNYADLVSCREKS